MGRSSKREQATRGTRFATYHGHTQAVVAVAWDPDGRRLATASHDGTACVWDVTTDAQVLSYRGHGSAVSDVAWSADGRFLASASFDGTVQIWHATSGETVLTYQSHTVPDRPLHQPLHVYTVAWSPTEELVASGGEDGTVQIWKALTGETAYSLLAHHTCVMAVAWSPDDRRIASANDSAEVLVWTLGETHGPLLRYYGGPTEAWALAWSPDGRRIASGYANGTAHVWEVTPGTQELPLPHEHPLRQEAWLIMWSSGKPESSYLTDDATFRRVAQERNHQPLIYSGHTSFISGIAWSPDGQRIASASGDGTVQVWKATTGRKQFSYRGHTGEVMAVAWSPDGRLIASGGHDGTAQVWRAD